MKNKILSGTLLFLFCTITIQSKAQLEVKTSGDVEAGANLLVLDSVISDKLRVSDNLIADHYKVDIKRRLYVGLKSTFNNSVSIAKNANIQRNLSVSQQASIGNENVSDSISLRITRTSEITDPYYGIHSHIKTRHTLPTGSVYAICGFADGSSTTNNYPSVNQIVGVCGKAYKRSEIINRFSAGVAGIANYYGGIGVYGGIGSTSDLDLPTTSPVTSCYAGYFAGAVNVNSTLIATNVSTAGDLRLSENVQQIPLSLAEKIHLLNPVSYTLKQDTLWKYDVSAKELQGTHYGLIAQDVQKVFPELVYERDNKLSINYIELIPLLIKTIQELSTEVEELKKQINKEQTK